MLFFTYSTLLIVIETRRPIRLYSEIISLSKTSGFFHSVNLSLNPFLGITNKLQLIIFLLTINKCLNDLAVHQDYFKLEVNEQKKEIFKEMFSLDPFLCALGSKDI